MRYDRVDIIPAQNHGEFTVLHFRGPRSVTYECPLYGEAGCTKARLCHTGEESEHIVAGHASHRRVARVLHALCALLHQ